jgi:HlyD family secretion protein
MTNMLRWIFPTVLSALLILGCANDDRTTLKESGTLEAVEVTVSTPVGGLVETVLVEEGAAVHAGDTLVILDSTDWVLQLKQAEAGLVMAEAQFKLAREGMRREDILQAEANYRNAEADLRRMEELFASNSVSQKQLDDARTRFTIAQQTYEKAKKGSRDEEIALAKARRDQAAAQVSLLKKKVNDCIVTAPIPGTVTKRFVERGELVGMGMALLTIANVHDMRVTVYLPETDIPKIPLGSRATVQIDAFPDRSYEGEVIYISPTAEFTPKNIQTRDERTKLVFGVKLRVRNPDGTLKAGIPADVTFAVSK